MSEDLEKIAREAPRWAYQDAKFEASLAFRRASRMRDESDRLKLVADEAEAAAVANHETKGDTK